VLRDETRPAWRSPWIGTCAAGLTFMLCLSRAGLCAQSNQFRSAKDNHVIRRIVDPFTGTKWVLTRDLLGRGGPGRLSKETRTPVATSSRAALPVVIRTGDRLAVEDRFPNGRGEFDAIALDRATEGSQFRVRLNVNGKIIRVMAVGPGRATIAREAEVAP